jgi:hypothetical protein
VPMSYIDVIITLACFLLVFGLFSFKYHLNAPIRHEIRAKDIIFRTSVKARVATALFGEVAINGSVKLIVRTDAFEVSHPFLLVRIILGQEYFFKAKEVTIEMHEGMWNREWIIIKGETSSRQAQISITNTHNLHVAWNALVSVGAVPVGPPPQAGPLPRS